MSSAGRRASRQFWRAWSSQSCLPLKQGRMGTPLSSWKAQEQAALSTSSTSLRARPRMRRSFTKQPSLEMKQCSRYRRCWIRSPSGSRKFRISFAQHEWLAVKIITSYFPRKLFSSYTAPGRMFIPAYACSPVGNLIVIFRSCSWATFSLQWMSVSSRSKTMVFLFSVPGLRQRLRIFDLSCYFPGIFEFSRVLRICRLCVRCSLAADRGSLQLLATSETQQVGLRGEQGLRTASRTPSFSGTWITSPFSESLRYLGALPCALAVSSSWWESLRICAFRCWMSSCLRAVRLLCEKTLIECSLRSMFSIRRRADATPPQLPHSYSISMLFIIRQPVVSLNKSHRSQQFIEGRTNRWRGGPIEMQVINRSISLEVAESVLSVLLDLEAQVTDAFLAVPEDFEAVDIVFLGGTIHVDAVAFLVWCLYGHSLAMRADLFHRVAQACVLHALQLTVYFVPPEPSVFVFLRRIHTSDNQIMSEIQCRDCLKGVAIGRESRTSYSTSACIGRRGRTVKGCMPQKVIIVSVSNDFLQGKANYCSTISQCYAYWIWVCYT